VPIWLGESGENTDEWIAQFVKARKKTTSGWAFWPYKKMEKSSAVVSIIPPADWGRSWRSQSFARAPRTWKERAEDPPEQSHHPCFAELLESVRPQKCA